MEKDEKKILEKSTRLIKKEAAAARRAAGEPKKFGGRQEGSGRKPFQPTAADRKQVEAMSGYGVPFEQIAALIQDGIHIDTLRTYFADELIAGKSKANAQIGKKMFQRASDGDITAMIWWTKCQMRWSEHREEASNAEIVVRVQNMLD